MRIGLTGQAMVREALLALLVLAVVFLNFGHGSVALAADGHVIVTSISVCGDPIPAPGDLDHAPCHACRIGNGADLPSPSTGAGPVAFIVQAVVYAAAFDLRGKEIFLFSGNARAPPAV